MNSKTIMIVDDEPSNLSVLSQILKPTFDVLACKSGEQALHAVGREPKPDLIMLDVMMPGMDGYEVLKRLRENENSRDIPVIFVTALSSDQDEEKGLFLGAVDYLTKPITPAIALARVRTHLEIKEGRDRLKDQKAWLEAEVARRMRENLLIQEVSLSVILELAETRDTDTGNHILRAQAYVEILARQLLSRKAFASELNKTRLNRIVLASPLHDIGKIGIPDNILLKPEKLLPQEWEIMKTHCRIGADAIGSAVKKALRANVTPAADQKPEIIDFLEEARRIAASHHERWDGAGYPDGLAGAAIPLSARLLALADVFDALTTPRVYKAPWGMDEAVRHIVQQRGTHFDPEVVDAFAASREAFESVHQGLADPEHLELAPDGAKGEIVR